MMQKALVSLKPLLSHGHCLTPKRHACAQAANPELDMPQILGMMQMAFENEDPPIPHVHRGGLRPSYETHPMAPGNLAAAAMLAHGQMGEEDDMADTGVDPAFCGHTAVSNSQLCACRVSYSLSRRCHGLDKHALAAALASKQICEEDNRGKCSRSFIPTCCTRTAARTVTCLTMP